VAQLQAEIKRGFLRALARQCATLGATLSTVLASFQDSTFDQIKTGAILVSSSGGGYSGTFDIGAIGKQMAPDQIFALSEELLTCYDEAVATLAAQTPAVTSPTDAQILSTMLASDRLQRVTSVRSDYMLLRQGGYL
jgi:hypothetical protein